MDMSFKWPVLDKSAEDRVLEMIRNSELSYYGNEGEVLKFEQWAKSYFGVKYALATNSGTNAILSAFFALDLKDSDIVLCQSYTFFSSAMPFFHTKGKIALIDSKPDEESVSVNDILTAIEQHKSVKAVSVTHLYGLPCEIELLSQRCKQKGIYLIEDCSHAHGSTYNNKLVGTFGDIGCFSFGAKKVLSGGSGGLLITNDQELYERALLLGHFNKHAQERVLGANKKYWYEGLGLNNRMHPISAAIINTQTKNLDAICRLRADMLSIINEQLSDTMLELPTTKEGYFRGAHYGFYLKLPKCYEITREDFLERLRTLGLNLGAPQYKPLHMLPSFQSESLFVEKLVTTYEDDDLPYSKCQWERAFSIPTYTYENDIPKLKFFVNKVKQAARSYE
ncbi:perosamine synthase [Vibrio cholerae]|nr:perosamine synthase [Vibrio cholerae]